MIQFPEITPDAVAAHYDDLDHYYRSLWGEHLHHGLWESGRESPEEAIRNLIDLVAESGRVRAADVCDVGCGYGGTSRVLAEDYHARVVGVTVSSRQIEFARSQTEGPNPEYRLQDWLQNEFPDESFDSVIAIESLAHMPDKRQFFRQACRVLRPGGRLVVCAWLSEEDPPTWQRRRLLEPICAEGRLPGMGSRSEYEDLIREQGMELESYRDLSQQVRRTWKLCAQRVLRHVARNPRELATLFDRRKPNHIFFFTLFRLRLAYRLGCMRYGLFVAECSGG